MFLVQPSKRNNLLPILNLMKLVCHLTQMSTIPSSLNFWSYVTTSYIAEANSNGKIFIQGVPIPMSQTFPGYSPPQNKQKSSYQHGSKNEQVPRYPVLCRNLRIAIKTAELPFHIRYDSHVTAVASYNKQVFIVHAWVVPRWLFVDRGGR